jgi:hypothetical protein
LSPSLTFQIDYEYPKSPSDAQGYVSLLHELRAGLEHLAASKRRPRGQYQLTVAAPCGWDNMQVLRIREMDEVLDFWNLMVSRSVHLFPTVPPVHPVHSIHRFRSAPLGFPLCSICAVGVA